MEHRYTEGHETRSNDSPHEQIAVSRGTGRTGDWPTGTARVFIQVLATTVYAGSTVRVLGADAILQDRLPRHLYLAERFQRTARRAWSRWRASFHDAVACPSATVAPAAFRCAATARVAVGARASTRARPSDRHHRCDWVGSTLGQSLLRLAHRVPTLPA